MTNVRIVTDSSALMDQEIIERLNITVVPLTVMIDGVLYQDGVTINGEEFMDKMAHAASLPKTSQPPIGEFEEVYSRIWQTGAPIISLHMTELLSGTVNSARQAAQLTGADVTVIDTKFIDQSLAFIVMNAAEMAQAGASKEEIIESVNAMISKTKLYIGVATLENLVKGGRIGRAVGMITSFLNIRAVFELTNTGLVMKSKGRGMKAFTKWFEGFQKELGNVNIKQIGISHAADSNLAEAFKKGIQEIYPDLKVTIFQTSSIVSTHTGSGAFAIMYLAE